MVFFKMFKRALISVFLLTFNCFAAEESVLLERFSQARYSTALKEYAKKQGRIKLKRALVSGALGVGVVGLGAWGIYSLTRPIKTSLEGTESQGGDAGNSFARERKNGLVNTFKGAFKNIAVFSLAGAILTMFNESMRDGYRAIKTFLSRPSTANALNPMSLRIKVELDRLRGSMKELHHNRNNASISKFHRHSVINSFNLLIHSLEKFGAILLWHTKNDKNSDELVLKNCVQNLYMLFSLCDEVALLLEGDLNKDEFTGFLPSTIEAVISFAQAVLFIGG